MSGPVQPAAESVQVPERLKLKRSLAVRRALTRADGIDEPALARLTEELCPIRPVRCVQCAEPGVVGREDCHWLCSRCHRVCLG